MADAGVAAVVATHTARSISRRRKPTRDGQGPDSPWRLPVRRVVAWSYLAGLALLLAVAAAHKAAAL
ncbi:hypothetical protein ACN20G_36705 (plasmid) [Streptomyces sp. BI20]|uniref:hypothetical protein n=1 Tax=Streptomyces sp. BI20 TaxID=3403460 RepID=UPI003C77BC7D